MAIRLISDYFLSKNQKAKANENSGGDPDVNVECVGGKKKIGGVQTNQRC